MTREALRQAWEQRRATKPPLVTDDGFGPHAIQFDEPTGCQLWQGAMKGNQPHASHRGTRVNPRRLAYERAYGAIPGERPLRPRCGQVRCITPEHQEPVVPKPPASPKPRAVSQSRMRRELTGRLPGERPSQIAERDWLVLTAVVEGRTLAEIAAELGVSRQRVHQLVERARNQLANDEVKHTRRSTNDGRVRHKDTPLPISAMLNDDPGKSDRSGVGYL